MKNGLRGLIAAAVLAVGLSACAAPSAAAVYEKESLIAKDSNNYSVVNPEQSVEDGTYAVTVERFEGVDTIWSYETQQAEETELTYQLAVKSGRAKLVLVAPDHSLTTIAEITPDIQMENPQRALLELRKGNNQIKLVAEENTQLELVLEVSVGELQPLG